MLSIATAYSAMVVQIYKSIFENPKKYPRVFIMARSAEIVNLESLRRIGTVKITKTTNKLGYQKIISTLSAVPVVPIVPIKISPHLCDKFPNLFHILQKSSIFAP